MKDKCEIITTSGFSVIRRITLLLVILILNITLLYSTEPIWVRPFNIKFNYEAGQTYDALTIRKADGTAITNPEWASYHEDYQNENFAYIKAQSSRKILVTFDSNCQDMHLVIKLTVTSGTGIGEICNLFVCNYHQLNEVELTLNGTLPNEVGKRTFKWTWEIYGIPVNNPGFCADLETTETEHTYYTLLATPQAPVTEPCINILDYACDWASGTNSASNVCTAILSNGFDSHYTWEMNCHRLSSDFVHLVSSLGISATLHRWASKDWDVGDMAKQRTRPIDPVGSTYGYGYIQWSWHQWAEAVSDQIDPSANTSKTGNWGIYEDDLFTHYQIVISYFPWYSWVPNQPGQSSGCEAPEHRIYSSSNIFYDWRGPDR